MEIIKKYSNYFASFFLMIFIGVAIGSATLLDTVLDEKYILERMEQVQFYEETSRSVKSGFEDYIYQSGFPLEILDGLFTNEDIERDVKSYLDYVYKGSKIKISTEKVQATLDNKINEYLSATGVVPDKLAKESISKFENLIVNEYSKNVLVTNRGIEMARKYVPLLDSLANVGLGISVVGIIALSIVLIMTNRKENITYAFGFFGVSVFCVGIIGLLAIWLIVSSVDIDNLLVLSVAISNFVICVSKQILYDLTLLFDEMAFAGFMIVATFSVLQGLPEKLIKMKYRPKLHRRKKH